MYTVAMYMEYGVCLGILVPHSTSLRLDSFKLSFSLAAWPLGSILAMALLPQVLKTSFIKNFTVIGCVHMLALSSLYLTGESKIPMLYGGNCALFIAGCCHFLLENRNNALLTKVLKGDTNKAVTSAEVCVTVGWSVGGFVGTVLYDNFGFAYTMLACGTWSCLFQATLVLLLCITDRSSSELSSSNEQHAVQMSSKEVYMLHLRKDLIFSIWMIEILSGSCMGFVEGNMVQFFISKYDKPIQFGGMILGVSAIFFPIMAVIVERILKIFPKMTSKLLVGGLFAKAITLSLIGPVFTTNNPGDLEIQSFTAS